MCARNQREWQLPSSYMDTPPWPPPPRISRPALWRAPPTRAAHPPLQVRKVEFGKGGVPYIATHDGRTIRYPDPEVKVGA